MLAFESITITLQDFPKNRPITLVRNLSLNLGDDEALAIIGPNGSGKSSLLKAMIGLITPVSGSFSLPSRSLGYMPQNYRSSVLSWISVSKHLELSLTATEAEYAHDLLDRMGVSLRPKQKLAKLSGGELQLLTLATQLAKRTKLLLLDEPLAAVDFARRRKVIDILKAETKGNGASLIMVSHHMDDASSLCDKFLVLSGGKQAKHQILSDTDGVNLVELFA